MYKDPRFCLQIRTMMEIISVDLCKTYRVSLFGRAILLLSCTSTHNEKKYSPSPSHSSTLFGGGGEGEGSESLKEFQKSTN